MFDVITIGGISIDLFFKGSALTYQEGRFQLAVGGKYITETFRESVGGAGANVAIGVAKHGLKVGVRGIIGEDGFRSIIERKLTQNNVSLDLCLYRKDYTNISSILLTEQGERSIVSYRSPHQPIINGVEDLNNLKNTKIVYMGNLPNVSIEERMTILHFFKNNSIPVVMNAGLQSAGKPVDEIRHLFDLVSVLILNTHEFADICGISFEAIDFTKDVVGLHAPFLKNNTVIVTAGDKGSYGYKQHVVYFQEAFPAGLVVDTTGAGDAYTAGFIAEYLKTSDLQRSMEEGSRYAVQILQKVGAN